MELHFEGLEMQIWNVATDIVQIVNEKMGSFLQLIPCLLKKISQLILNVLPKLWLKKNKNQQKEQKSHVLHFSVITPEVNL